MSVPSLDRWESWGSEGWRHVPWITQRETERSETWTLLSTSYHNWRSSLRFWNLRIQRQWLACITRPRGGHRNTSTHNQNEPLWFPVSTIMLSSAIPVLCVCTRLCPRFPSHPPKVTDSSSAQVLLKLLVSLPSLGKGAYFPHSQPVQGHLRPMALKDHLTQE